jgi:hypothetical protein
VSTQPSPVGFQFVVKFVCNKFVWPSAMEYNANSVQAIIVKNWDAMVKMIVNL